MNIDVKFLHAGVDLFFSRLGRVFRRRAGFWKNRFLQEVHFFYERWNLHLFLNRLSVLFGAFNILPAYPVVLMVEPINACTFRCPCCPTGSGQMNRPVKEMDLMTFKKIIDQARGRTKIVSLWNYGEPFLNKELLQMVRYAAGCGMHVVVSTNGECLKTRESCLELIKSGLQHLIVSLNSSSWKNNEDPEKDPDFQLLKENSLRLRAVKTELASRTPLIELQLVLTKYSERTRDAIQNLVSRWGADLFTEKTLLLDTNDPSFQGLAREFLPEDPRLRRYQADSDGIFRPAQKIPNRCSFVYFGMVINSDGSVVPCCWDSYSRHVMGNISTDKIKDIWKSDSYRTFRNDIRKNRKDISICCGCPEGVSRRKIKRRLKTDFLPAFLPEGGRLK